MSEPITPFFSLYGDLTFQHISFDEVVDFSEKAK